MKKEFKEKLEKYLAIEAMSRYEQPVAEFLKNNIKKGSYEISYDNFGSIIFHKPSKVANAPKIMVAAHMDEVGYLVRDIDKSGQILLSPVGGIWPTVVVGTKATLISSKNERFEGVFGHTSIHIMQAEEVSKSITNDKLYADFGFKSKEDALTNGIEIGDRVLVSGETIQLKNQDLVAGKSMDNRAGVCTLEYIANALADEELGADVYLVGTVQEEVGTRGAKTSVSIINPQVAIALDTTSSHDTIGTIPGTTKLGAGAAIRLKDGGMMADPRLVEFVCEIGKNKNIAHYKFISMGGGTDAAQLQYAKGGAATLTISLPQRYLHSPIGICDVNDLIAAKDLIVETIKALNPESYNKKLKYH